MSDISNKELIVVIKDMNIRSDEKTRELILSLEESMKKDIELAVINAKDETLALIESHLPDDHDNDHSTVKMVRGWGRSFFNGLFGSAGKVVFIIFVIGITVQVLNGKEPLTRVLTEVVAR